MTTDRMSEQVSQFDIPRQQVGPDPVPRADGERASHKEEALWLLEEFVPGTGVNNLSVAFRVEGRLRRSVLLETVTRLLRRHEVLRTVFRTKAAGLMREVLRPEESDLRIVAGDPGPEGARAWLTRFVAEPFRPDGGLLVRAAVVPEASGEVFCLAVHHSVFDGLSSALLLTECVSLYNTLASGGVPGPETVVPAWREPTPNPASARFWRGKLDGFRATELDLWCQKPDASVTTLAGDVLNHALSPAARDAVRRMRRELRAPESVVLLAAYSVLLAAHGAGPDLTVGSPVSVRSAEAARTIGYHINVLTLRTPVDRAECFREFVRSTRRTFMEAMAHADYPVDDLLEVVERDGGSWRNNLFRHTFNYVPAATDGEFVLDGQRAEAVVVENSSSKFDLEFFVTSTATDIKVRAAFYVDVLDRADVELLVARYDELLVTLAQWPDRALAEIPVWCERDRRVIGSANATDRPVEPTTVLESIARRVRASGAAESGADAEAVLDGGRRVGIRRLWAAAEATRDRLFEAGVGRGDVVALLAARGPELAAATIGVWLAGAVYLPLEPSHPEQRISYQLDDSGAAAVVVGPGITVAGERRVLPLVDVDSVRPVTGDVLAVNPVGPLDHAYLIYTSGSTGLPKGTLLDHRNLANLVAHFADELSVGPEDTVLWLTTFSFDISALELFLPLVSGGRLAVAPDDARTQGEPLARVLRDHDVSVLQATPTTWRLVVEEVAEHLAGRRVLSGGEPLPAVLARRLGATGCDLYNVYGPTETTIWSTSGRIDRESADGRVDVGRPIANTRVYVADPDGRALPLGVRGELCIAGEGVAVGYHDRPELTAARFGEHPPYGRFYRTGDLARWTGDGRLEILGRLDRQVKLRGNRIELGEIEAVLLSHPDVVAAAVVVAGDPSADALLCAFVVAPERPEVVSELWEYAHGSLPVSATPQEFVAVDAFPMTGNDKVDYPALARQASARRRSAAEEPRADASAAGGSGDRDELVEVLVGLWGTLLERGGLHADANFFAHGGHSLLGVRLLQEVRVATRVRLKLKDLFDAPTPAGLAAKVRTALDAVDSGVPES
ncbi:non-ribosomal peptide synthetase [Embleya hyalina]|uniref:Non-ribosomal peptide synthetase n=1 Tax=Embleya hyalina TaxID=516124 RepID=A0A401Z2L4_9ACTN|nr:non-ribosomal peptide synthetase [Embleya hyalina]GCE01094.1 non-ribosomal peptide synthetase [Embleya hyalina]